MSVDTLPEPETSPVLRREALLPNERSRGLGTVAVVCTMAGVASGLALATTLMAMQVADSMSVRSCPYRVVQSPEVQQVELRGDHGFLGIQLVFHHGFSEIVGVMPNSPAAAIGLHVGDHVRSLDGSSIRSKSDLQDRIFASHPGAQPQLVIERNGTSATVVPTLSAWPVVQ